MTVSQELREWADRNWGIAWLPATGWDALGSYLGRLECLDYLSWYDRRTFALLVAEALEN